MAQAHQFALPASNSSQAELLATQHASNYKAPRTEYAQAHFCMLNSPEMFQDCDEKTDTESKAEFNATPIDGEIQPSRDDPAIFSSKIGGGIPHLKPFSRGMELCTASICTLFFLVFEQICIHL